MINGRMIRYTGVSKSLHGYTEETKNILKLLLNETID